MNYITSIQGCHQLMNQGLFRPITIKTAMDSWEGQAALAKYHTSSEYYDVIIFYTKGSFYF